MFVSNNKLTPIAKFFENINLNVNIVLRFIILLNLWISFSILILLNTIVN